MAHDDTVYVGHMLDMTRRVNILKFPGEESLACAIALSMIA
jgi:hypothetical protein